MKVANKRDMLAGLLMMSFGLAAMLIGRNYRMGTIARMGPGYFPVGVGILLLFLGGVITVRAFKWKEAGWPKVAWRPLLLVTGAILLFGILLKSAGLILALFALVAISRLSRPEFTWVETISLCLVISAICAGIFYFGLKLNLPLWVRFW